MTNDKKTPKLMGRPKGSKKYEPILEESVFVKILDRKLLTFKDYWELYKQVPDLEVRAKLQRLPTEDGVAEFLPRDEVETVENNTSQNAFKDWFTKRGLKMHRLANLLSILGLKIVIVPFHAKVTVACEGCSSVKCDDVGETNISIFCFDETGAREKLVMEDVPLPKTKVLLRKARASKEQLAKAEAEGNND